MKKSRLLEIIREEISATLNEAGIGDQITALDKQIEAATKQLAPLQKKLADLTGKKADLQKKEADLSAKTQTQLEEDLLNEMAFALEKGLAPSEKLEPRYKKENFKKVVDLILSKVDGKKTMADVARELGVIQQKIRPVVSDLLDAGILEKGEAESKSGKDVANKPGPKAKAKEEPKAKAEKAPKAKKATLTPGDDGFDDVSYSEEDDEVAAATKAISGDETAKELGNTPEEKKVKFNQFLASVKKNKDDKAKIEGILKLAKEKFKFPKTMMDDLKRAAGRDVEV